MLARPTQHNRPVTARRVRQRLDPNSRAYDPGNPGHFLFETAQTITARAGVTWGAVQHQFGGKDELLLAVLEDSFHRFAERIAGIAVAGTTLDQRASLFVDRAWEHFRSRQ